jgi:hypothetical protein
MSPRRKIKHPAAVALGNLAKRSAARREAGKAVKVQPAERAAASALGQLGGRARALRLTSEQRRAIAAKAAATRWTKVGQSD